MEPKNHKAGNSKLRIISPNSKDFKQNETRYFQNALTAFRAAKVKKLTKLSVTAQMKALDEYILMALFGSYWRDSFSYKIGFCFGPLRRGAEVLKLLGRGPATRLFVSARFKIWARCLSTGTRSQPCTQAPDPGTSLHTIFASAQAFTHNPLL